MCTWNWLYIWQPAIVYTDGPATSWREENSDTPTVSTCSIFQELQGWGIDQIPMTSWHFLHIMARRRKLRCRLKNAQECRPLKHGSSHACAIGMCLLCFDSLEITLLVWMEDTSFPGPASDARISMVLTKMQWMRKSFHSIHSTLTMFFSVIRVVSGGRYRPEQFNTKA